MINSRLFDWYGIDTNKNLKQTKVCARPFDTMLFDRNGEVFACECTAWLPVPIGNINLQTVKEIEKNKNTLTVQNSISDGSYRFCNNHQCKYLISNRIPTQTETKHIRLAIDESCNLACPSCRTNKIFISDRKILNKKISWCNKIIEWMQEQKTPVQVHIGSDGDPLKQMYDRTSYIFNNLNALNISIDGATKVTYEKLRLGGRWEKILENFEFIKKNKNYPVNLHMVVQTQNWNEMKLMLDLADFYNFDKVYFNQIEDWNTAINVKEEKKLFAELQYQAYTAEIKKHPKAYLF
jgi:sulfatase maturation enzyme AslB (radical SAM superfamily)